MHTYNSYPNPPIYLYFPHLKVCHSKDPPIALTTYLSLLCFHSTSLLLGTEVRASCMQGKHVYPELQPQPLFFWVGMYVCRILALWLWTWDPLALLHTRIRATPILPLYLLTFFLSLLLKLASCSLGCPGACYVTENVHEFLILFTAPHKHRNYQACAIMQAFPKSFIEWSGSK